MFSTTRKLCAKAFLLFLKQACMCLLTVERPDSVAPSSALGPIGGKTGPWAQTC